MHRACLRLRVVAAALGDAYRAAQHLRWFRCLPELAWAASHWKLLRDEPAQSIPDSHAPELVVAAGPVMSETPW